MYLSSTRTSGRPLSQSASEIMCPVVVSYACIKPGLEDDVMVPDDCLEALLAHKETQRLHGILSTVTEIPDGVEDVRIRIV